MVLVPWRWYGELSSFPKEMNQLFDRFFGGELVDRPWEKASYPPVTVTATDSEVVVRVEIHGFLPQDLEISFQQNVLLIKGSKARRKNIRGRRSQYVGHMVDSFLRTVPVDQKIRVEEIDAKYNDGILLITLPKAPEASAPFKVTIK